MAEKVSRWRHVAHAWVPDKFKGDCEDMQAGRQASRQTPDAFSPDPNRPRNPPCSERAPDPRGHVHVPGREASG